VRLIMKNESQYDQILVGLVPKIVDTNPQLFEDTKEYWGYSVGQVQEFLGRLPETYTGKVSEERFEESKSAMFTCTKSPQNLMIGFKPGYFLSVTDDNYISCPTFDVIFRPTDKEVTETILQTGLDQFFLNRMNEDTSALMVCGIKDKQIISSGLELLAQFLPSGTVIEARDDYRVSNGQITYTL